MSNANESQSSGKLAAHSISGPAAIKPDNTVSGPNAKPLARLPVGPAIAQQLDMPPGLVLGVCDAPDVAQAASFMFLMQTAQAAGDTGMKFPNVTTVRYLTPGAERSKDAVNAYIQHLGNFPASARFKLVGIGTSTKFDFLSPEGRLAVLPNLTKPKEDGTEKSPSAVILVQEVHDPSSALFMDSLMKFRLAAKAANCTVIMLLSSEYKFEEQDLAELADECCVIEECMPDFDHYSAFSLDCLSLRSLNRFGIGKTLCSSRVAAGRLAYTFEPFISKDVRERVMWSMRCAGHSYAEIGDQFNDVHKTTVMRRLNKLPTTDGRTVDKERLAQLLDYLDPASKARKGSAAAISDCDDEYDDSHLDLDDDDDDEDEPPKKKSANKISKGVLK